MVIDGLSFEEMQDKIFCQDCLEGMRHIPDGSIDCIVSSPPYNTGLEYNGYKDSKPYAEYLEWMTSIFAESFRVLGNDGRMVVNIGDGKNGAIPTHSDFIQICKLIGFSVLTTIIWNKNTTSNRTAWGSFMSPSSPSFPRCFEFILVFRKSDKLLRKGIPTISKENFVSWSNGMWSIGCEKLDKIGHPAAFPVELPQRCIELLTYKGDVILDPFVGSGTTAIAAIREKRHFIGFELNAEYYQKAMKRIQNELSQPTLF